MTYVILLWGEHAASKPNKRLLSTAVLLIIVLAVISVGVMIWWTTTNNPNYVEYMEIREYEGQDLSSINHFAENSIRGPQQVDINDYNLTITGLVDDELVYTYDEVVNDHQNYKKVVTLKCVEGWSATILWEGVRIKDLLQPTQISPEANTVIFYAYDGYTTALPLDYILDNNIMIAHTMNNVTLPEERGYPFQLVAESKWGYKWIKWLTQIEISDNEDYLGFWESRNWPNDADL